MAQVKIPLTPGYQVLFADHVRKHAEIPTGAVGLITSAQQAEEILTSGKADAIFDGARILERSLLSAPRCA